MMATAPSHVALKRINCALIQQNSNVLNIVSGAACHGPNAEGVGAIPRLGGLSYLYLKRKLEQWGEGYHMTAQFPMPQVSVKLSPDTIEALASYLSFVR